MTRLAAISLFAVLPAFATLPVVTRNAIDQVTGIKGVYIDAEDIHKISIPRTDVKVSADRWALPPSLGLTSWAAFTTGTEKEAMMTAELVVFEDEANPVISAALDNGLEVTALHNHHFFDNPRVMYLHLSGQGRGSDLARGVRMCLDRIRDVRRAGPLPAPQFSGSEGPALSKISAAPIEKVLGFKGQSTEGMYKAVIERHARLHGREVGGQMGITTWVAFAGTDNDSLVSGEFAMTIQELQPVLKALRASGINVTGIHHHMTQEEPPYVFLHYWGKGNAVTLAKGVRSAIDKLAITSVTHIGHQAH
jgi:hypothetical protein